MRYANNIAASFLILFGIAAHAETTLVAGCNACNTTQARNIAKNTPPNVAGAYSVYVIDANHETMRKFRVNVSRNYIDEYGGGYYRWVRRAFGRTPTADELAANATLFALRDGHEHHISDIDSAADVVSNPQQMAELNGEFNYWFDRETPTFRQSLFDLLSWSRSSYPSWEFFVPTTFTDDSMAKFRYRLVQNGSNIDVETEYVDDSARDSTNQPIPDEPSDVDHDDRWRFHDADEPTSTGFNDWQNFLMLVDLYGIPVGGGGGGFHCTSSWISNDVVVHCRQL